MTKTGFRLNIPHHKVNTILNKQDFFKYTNIANEKENSHGKFDCCQTHRQLYVDSYKLTHGNTSTRSTKP